MIKIINSIRFIWFWLTVPVICSWCNRVKHHAPMGFLGDGNASHGFCSLCEQKFIADLHEIERGNALTTTRKLTTEINQDCC